MNNIFVDTGALVSRILPRDQHHSASLEGWRILENVDVRLISSEHVLDESVSLLVRQAGTSLAARWAREHLASGEVILLSSSHDDWQEALRWLEKFADQRISFTDALSFALMRRERIEQAFSFDRHFALAGFELWPPP